MVYDATIDFLGYAVVITTVPGFHMKNRDLAAGSCDRRKSAVRIAEYKDTGRPMRFEQAVAFCNYLSELISKTFRLYSEMHVWRSYLEVFDENVTEAFIIILSGMHRDVFAVLIQNFHDQAEPDYFRPGAENRHYLHIQLVRLPVYKTADLRVRLIEHFPQCFDRQIVVPRRVFARERRLDLSFLS